VTHYVRGAHAAVVVASLVDITSLENLIMWREFLSENCSHVPPAILVVTW
jgi:hypothetical protein